MGGGSGGGRARGNGGGEGGGGEGGEGGVEARSGAGGATPFLASSSQPLGRTDAGVPTAAAVVAGGAGGASVAEAGAPGGGGAGLGSSTRSSSRKSRRGRRRRRGEGQAAHQATRQAPAGEQADRLSPSRKRRLSVTAGQVAPKVAAPDTARHSSVVMYRSEEIGTAPDVLPLPFPDAKVGTYSCHGVEPSYSEDDGVTAKINQDRGCVVYPFKNDPKHALFSVFDGHGEHGDIVSHFVMHDLQSRLAAHPLIAEDPGTALKESYLAVDSSLSKLKPQEATFSGTTAVSVLMREDQLWIANAGDSRAVIAQEEGGALKSLDLSVDQNPNSPAEQARIEAAGGFVSPPPEPGLSSRVWLDKAMTQIGLAMARSIGDHAVKSIGVVAEPEITKHTISAGDKFIVLASDGVWEFISSQEAVDIVNNSLAEGTMKVCATQDLIEAAATKWREVEGDYRDDITAVVVRLPCFPE
eukprot:jgi/Undpi1/95/HiC_scaffold_1.g00095.m1